MEVRSARPYVDEPTLDRVEVDGRMRNIKNQLADSQNRLVEVWTQAENGEDKSRFRELMEKISTALAAADEIEWNVHASHGAH